MTIDELALRDTPAELTREITRFGGVNPFGRPQWRVVLARNVRQLCYGTMRHMPRVTEESVSDEAGELRDFLRTIEPERYESGEFWLPRYEAAGWILERWFPASAWGDREAWEQETAEDGVTRMNGPWPAQGDYYWADGRREELMSLPPAEYWKREIARLLWEQAEAATDPDAYLAAQLADEKARDAARKEAYLNEVNAVHRGVVEPLLATVGPTAQRVRDGLAKEAGLSSLNAG